MSSDAYLTWAINQEGDLVHVDEVPNGNDCGCICPHCKSKLCAKNGGDGEKMIHHFAHLSGADCAGAVEALLGQQQGDIGGIQRLLAEDSLQEDGCDFADEIRAGQRRKTAGQRRGQGGAGRKRQAIGSLSSTFSGMAAVGLNRMALHKGDTYVIG